MTRSDAIAMLTKVLFSILFLVVLISVAKIVASKIRSHITRNALEEDHYTHKLSELIYSVTYWLLITFAVMVFFQMVGVNIWFLITWLTFGIWYAIKDILWNMFAGIMILTNKKFTIWDIVEFQGKLKYFGKIKEISIRYTVVQTFDKRRVIVPNILLVQNFVKTFSIEKHIKIELDIDVWFQDDPILFCEDIKDLINTKDFVIQPEATKVTIWSISHSGYIVKMYFYVPVKNKVWLIQIRSQIRKEVLDLVHSKYHYARDHIALTTDKQDKWFIQTALFALDKLK